MMVTQRLWLHAGLRADRAATLESGQPVLRVIFLFNTQPPGKGSVTVATAITGNFPESKVQGRQRNLLF